MKKICLIAWERFSYGGISRVLSDIVTGLSENHEITILCLKNAAALENVYGIDFSKVRIVHKELTFAQKLRREFVDRYLYKILRKFTWGIKYYQSIKYSRSYRNWLISVIGNNYDIVIGASGLNESYLLSSIAPRIGGTKIGWMHTSFEGYFLQGSTTDVDYALKMGKANLSKLDKLVVLSKSDEKKFSLFCETSFIYNPVPFSTDSRANLSSQTFVFVGALSGVKGADILIDAFVLFAKKEKQWKLSIHGDGPMWKYIKETVKKNGLEERVSLKHSTKNVKSIYLGGSALLFPSRLEGFGIVQGEAMICGLPVLAHRLPITEELIASQECGLLYDNNSAEELCSLMERYAELNIDRKTELQQNAVRFAGSLTKDTILERWNQCILQ